MALTAAQILEVKRLRAQTPPVPWSSMEGRFGTSATTIRMDVDPAYRARRMEQINARRRGAHGKRYKPRVKLQGHNPEGNNGSLLARVRQKKQKPNFATFGHATEFPKVATLPVPDMDDATIVGVDYHANTGCKYILGDRRGGPMNLPLCCGGERAKRYVNGTEITLPYCLPHALRTGTGNYGRGR